MDFAVYEFFWVKMIYDFFRLIGLSHRKRSQEKVTGKGHRILNLYNAETRFY
jgi:hypothetical protein